MKAMNNILACAFLTLLSAIAMGKSTATLVSDTEDISARNATTRIFNRTYSVPIMDAQFQPTSDTRTETRTLIEKADGLCYDASLNDAHEAMNAPRWELTDTRFVADLEGGWSIVTGPAKIRIASTASVSNLVSYTIPFRIPNPDKDDESHPYLKRSLSLKLNGGALYYYDTITARKIVLSAPSPVAGRADGNRVIFEGAYPCGDLEFVYDKGAFHQNVIIRNVKALPSPASLGLDPALTELRVVTDIEDASAENSGAVVHAAETGFRMTGPSGKVLCSFVQSFAFPTGAAQDRRIMTKAVAPIPGETKKYSHAEGVPYSYVLEKSFGGDLVLDYGLGTVTEEISQAWQAGYTYWITSDYTVVEGKTLVIEGGAVVKVRDDASLMGDGGNVLIKGTPFNYALFTKESDNTVGETVTPANSNNVYNFLWFYFTPDTSLQVQFAKFANADDRAIWINSASSGEGGFVEVRDSIFRDCNDGVGVGGDFYMDDSRINIFNCLFVNSHVRLNTSNTLNAYVQNCTFDGESGNNYGIKLYGDDFYAIFQNNFYANMPYAVSGNATFESGSCINYDATCTVTARLSSTIATALSNAGGTSTPTNTGSSFVTCSNGDHYLGEPAGNEPTTGTSDNLSEDYEDRLSSTTVIRPAEVDDELDLLDRTDWQDYWTDAGDPDIGFHYDIVHGEVSGYQYLSESIDLEPGIAISIDEESQIILNGEDNNFNSCGLPHKRIRYISMNATSDKISDPYRISQMSNGGVAVGNGASLTCDFSEFSFLELGLFADSYATCDIKNTVFHHNDRALWLLGRGQTTRIQNCLFSNSAITAVDFMGYDMTNLNIIGCTFDRNEYSIAYENGPWGSHVCNAVIEDNIFTNNNEVVGNSNPELTVNAIVRNNLFWNNEQDVSTIYTDSTNLLTSNSLFVHRAQPLSGDVLQNWASDKEAPWDGYYLAQRSGDASRRPFAFRSDQILAEENGVEIEGIKVRDEYSICGTFWFWITAGFPSSDLEKEDDHRCFVTASLKEESSYYEAYSYSRGNQTIEGPLFLMFYFDGEVEFEEDARISLTFENGQVLNIYLPALLNPDYIHFCDFLYLWVAEDGSAYWAEESQSPTQNERGISTNFMDAYYSIRWREGNLAKGAYDGRAAASLDAASPAVDAGSKDWLNGGTTKTDVDGNGNIPDNPAPANFGDPDNLDEYGDPTFIDWNDGSHLLDIGYHYGGAQQDKDSDVVYTTLRHPKERITEVTTGTVNLLPNIISADDMVLVSGKYNDSTGKDLTMAIYKTNLIYPSSELACFKRFRGGSSEAGVIGNCYDHLTIAATSGPANDSMGGAIYAAVYGWNYEGSIGHGVNIYEVNRILKVFRYEESTISWTEIGSCDRPGTDTTITLGKPELYQPVSLTAQNNDLWVFWIEDQRGVNINYTMLLGSHIPNAATRNDSYTIDANNNNLSWLRDLQFLPTDEADPENIALKCDWDSELGGNFDGQPRIVFVDDYKDSSKNGVPEVWSTRVIIDQNNGMPYSLDNQYNTKIIEDDSIKPTFCVNKPLDRFDIDLSQNRAFCSFEDSDQTQVGKLNLKIENDIDIWYQPQNPAISFASQPTISYRAFGIERLFYLKDYMIYEEHLGIFDQATGSVSYPKITTARPKPENMFLLHQSNSSSIVDVNQIMP